MQLVREQSVKINCIILKLSLIPSIILIISLINTKCFEIDCQMLQIISGGAIRFTRFSRPQYDEAIPAAARKP